MSSIPSKSIGFAPTTDAASDGGPQQNQLKLQRNKQQSSPSTDQHHHVVAPAVSHGGSNSTQGYSSTTGTVLSPRGTNTTNNRNAYKITPQRANSADVFTSNRPSNGNNLFTTLDFNIMAAWEVNKNESTLNFDKDNVYLPKPQPMQSPKQNASVNSRFMSPATPSQFTSPSIGNKSMLTSPEMNTSSRIPITPMNVNMTNKARGTPGIRSPSGNVIITNNTNNTANTNNANNTNHNNTNTSNNNSNSNISSLLSSGITINRNRTGNQGSISQALQREKLPSSNNTNTNNTNNNVNNPKSLLRQPNELVFSPLQSPSHNSNNNPSNVNHEEQHNQPKLDQVHSQLALLRANTFKKKDTMNQASTNSNNNASNLESTTVNLPVSHGALPSARVLDSSRFSSNYNFAYLEYAEQKDTSMGGDGLGDGLQSSSEPLLYSAGEDELLGAVMNDLGLLSSGGSLAPASNNTNVSNSHVKPPPNTNTNKVAPPKKVVVNIVKPQILQKNFKTLSPTANNSTSNDNSSNNNITKGAKVGSTTNTNNKKDVKVNVRTTNNSNTKTASTSTAAKTNASVRGNSVTPAIQRKNSVVRNVGTNNTANNSNVPMVQRKGSISRPAVKPVLHNTNNNEASTNNTTATSTEEKISAEALASLMGVKPTITNNANNLNTPASKNNISSLNLSNKAAPKDVNSANMHNNSSTNANNASNSTTNTTKKRIHVRQRRQSVAANQLALHKAHLEEMTATQQPSVLTPLQYRWNEVNFLLRKTIDCDEDFHHTHSHAVKSRTLIDCIGLQCEKLETHKGKLARMLQPYNDDTSAADQASSALTLFYAEQEKEPTLVAQIDAFQAAYNDRQLYSNRYVDLSLYSNCQDQVLAACDQRQLVRVKIADENDQAQAERSIHDIITFCSSLSNVLDKVKNKTFHAELKDLEEQLKHDEEQLQQTTAYQWCQLNIPSNITSYTFIKHYLTSEDL